MNKLIISLLLVILIITGIITITNDNTIESIQTQNNGSEDVIPIPTPYFNWNGFYFNDSKCNENNTESYHESRKVNRQWQIVTVLTCLNQTVRIIPV